MKHVDTTKKSQNRHKDMANVRSLVSHTPVLLLPTDLGVYRWRKTITKGSILPMYVTSALFQNDPETDTTRDVLYTPLKGFYKNTNFPHGD